MSFSTKTSLKEKESLQCSQRTQIVKKLIVVVSTMHNVIKLAMYNFNDINCQVVQSFAGECGLETLK